MGKKKIKELKAQIKETQKTLEALEKKKDKKVLKAQHKVVEDLETMMDDDTLRRESLLELGEEAWQEAKALLGKVKSLIVK
jgi:phosphoenolpyruvate-protein kinase (PTS system EI component)